MPSKRRRVKLDEFHYHEALHTASVLMETFGEHVGEHPVVSQDKALEKLADAAVSAMYEVYNAIALKRLDKFQSGKSMPPPNDRSPRS